MSSSAYQNRRSDKTFGFLLACAALGFGGATQASAQASSAPAILQMFEARWNTIENRTADIFSVGYGKMWLPPPERAGPSGSNVGYEVFDRFDLGRPGNPTLYGTEDGLKGTIAAGHTAGLEMYTDFVPNHNGRLNQNTPGFLAQGGYNGFVLSLPDDQFGDFHNAAVSVNSDEVNGSLLNLIDIAQEKTHAFIRHPVEAGHPNNIPAGSIYNKPDPNNARFYPDQGLGGLALNDPRRGEQVTRHAFNAGQPLAGDPVLETALGLLMRNAQWMVQVIGVDGFRVDAAKHMPVAAHTALDQAVFRANPRLQLDGSIQPVFFMGEVYDGSENVVQRFIRKDLPNGLAIRSVDTTVAGNRDALDFPLYFALSDNLANDNSNNWSSVRNASIDTNDRPAGQPSWASDGSQGVSFVQNHDVAPPFLANVGYAYTLMRPGNALVYLNAREFGNNRGFPRNGKVDALGGFHGETITRLVDLRNTHGRGNYLERSTSTDVYIYERENSAIVGLSNQITSGSDARTNVQTSFAPGSVLVELTGNAANALVDPEGVISEAIRVSAQGQVNMAVPRNSTHGLGYVIYGLAPPQGTLSLEGTSGVLAGASPTASNNGTARLETVDVVSGDVLTLRLTTTPITLPAPSGESAPVRDIHADGDDAMFKIDGGIDLNNRPGLEDVTPGSVTYGFESFTTTRTPGYIHDDSGNIGTGFGSYEQLIDTTQLAEGRHYVTVRAFRNRNAAKGGDGGPAVFSDHRRTIYVDRLPPDSDVISFAPHASNPSNLNNRNMIVSSVDETADRIRVFLDLPAAVSNAEVLEMAVDGQGAANAYDRAQWSRAFNSVTTGNHVATVVTFEPTFDGSRSFNVQRFSGLLTQTNIGAGFGDLNANGQLDVADLTGAAGFEQVLYSQNLQFNAAADVTGDGLVDNRDLFALEGELIAKGVSSEVLTEYDDALRRRANLDGNGVTDAADLAALYANLGDSSWLYDLNVDGIVDANDAVTLITRLCRTVPGDFNLDGAADGTDFLLWQRHLGQTDAASLVADGDFDGDVDGGDYYVLAAGFGFQRGPLTVGSADEYPVPEPDALMLFCIYILCGATAGRR